MASKRDVVLVRTRPLEQGNYGGILQAYALQQTLLDLGMEPVTDLSAGVTQGARSTEFVRRFKHAVKIMLGRIGPRRYVRETWVLEAIRKSRDQHVMKFVEERISSIRLYGALGRVKIGKLAQVDAFITGSDQVWRAAFGRIPTYLFDFLPIEDARPRIAYAASFGTDENEYSPNLIAETRPLAQKLSATSVRESGGIRLARSLWDIDAMHVLDPTMLLGAEHYSDLADSATDPIGTQPYITYVLDDHAATRNSVDIVAASLKAEPFALTPPVPNNFRDYQSFPDLFARPSIEAWLGAMRDARFVVTDSFHGTVFSILFNRPFIALANNTRGTSRFESLLTMVGLTDRLVAPGAVLPKAVINAPIDWGHVNNRLQAEQNASLTFLRSALSSAHYRK